MSSYVPDARELKYDSETKRFYVDEELLVKRVFGEDYQDAWQRHINELDPTRLIPSRNGVGYFAGMYFNGESIPVRFEQYSFEIPIFDNYESYSKADKATRETPAWKRLLREGFTDYQPLPRALREFHFESAPGWLLDSFAYDISSLRALVDFDNFDLSAAKFYDLLNDNVLKAYISNSIAENIRNLYWDLHQFWLGVGKAVHTLAAEASKQSDFWKAQYDAVPDFREIIRLELKLLFDSRVVDESGISCANCGSQREYVCTKCNRAGYCSEECQREHWIKHKATCK